MIFIIALNHFGLWVDDIEAAVKQLSARGMRFAPGGIRKVHVDIVHDVIVILIHINDECIAMMQ
jgi:lactoylglutathione lyase